MKRRLKEPFGKAGLTVAILALVLAMVGGAYAAAGLTKAQEKQVTKIAKKYAGKPGTNGTNGTNGSNGAPGKEGPEGKAGASGTNGKSIIAETVSAGIAGECNGEGGSSFHQEGSATKHFACNGEPGETGFTETLPKGQTETGVWGFSAPKIEASVTHSTANFESFSFPIPLKQAPDSHFILPNGEEFIRYESNSQAYLTKEEEEQDVQIVTQPATPQCPGSASRPKATEGNLCVYSLLLNGPVVLFGNFTNFPSGVLGQFSDLVEGREEAAAAGSWAVTSAE